MKMWRQIFRKCSKAKNYLLYHTSSVGESYFLKVMHYNIALLPNVLLPYLVTFMESNALRYFLNLGRACLLVFNKKKESVVKALSQQ